MFSSRFHWSGHTNPLTRLLRERRADGAEVLDLTESNPTHAGLDYPQAEILAALADGESLRYDPVPLGMYSAREAVAHYYAGHRMEVPASRILLTASTSEAYSYLFKLLLDPGDEVLVPRPSYPLFEYLASMECVKVKQYPLRYDGAWHIDFAELEAAIGSRTKAIVVVNPNNPTGSYLKQDEYFRLDTLAAARGLAVLSDEVFTDYAFAPNPDRVSTLTGHCEALTFSMSGLSKTAGLPQMKLGWIVAGGPGREEALERLEWIADTFLSVASPIQVALPRILTLATGIRRQILERTTTNLAALRKLFRGRGLGQVLNTEGGWYAVARVPNTRNEEQWTLDLLEKDGVLVQPGFFYDFESEAFLVLSLLTPPEMFQTGIERIDKRLL